MLKHVRDHEGRWVVRDDVGCRFRTGHGHHWYGNAESYFLIGDALGRAMVQLIDLETYILPVHLGSVLHAANSANVVSEGSRGISWQQPESRSRTFRKFLSQVFVS